MILTHDVSGLICFIREQPEMLDLLQVVAQTVQLPDCWVGAGFLRNAVWDHLHGRAVTCVTLRDVDVVYFDRVLVDPERDHAAERALRARLPGVPWEVKNQARMHVRNGDRFYRDTSDAIAQWPETATALGARYVDGQVELTAPLGLTDLFGLIVRPTPRFREKPDAYRARRAGKDWARRWPMLRFLD